MCHLVVSSLLDVSPEEFWAGQSLAAVNDELGPWVRMSAPAEWQGQPLEDWRGRDPLFKSWVLLFGLVPVDRHSFGTFMFDQSSGFCETSSSWINSLWEHVRTVEPTYRGCEVVDRVRYAPRIPALSFLFEAIYSFVFRHRHKKLRARYSSRAG